jgi:hypothetical protein
MSDNTIIEYVILTFIGSLPIGVLCNNSFIIKKTHEIFHYLHSLLDFYSRLRLLTGIDRFTERKRKDVQYKTCNIYSFRTLSVLIKRYL